MIRIRHFLLVLVSLLISWGAWAQVTFRAEAPLLVSLDERVRVEFTINKEPDGDKTFQAPSFEGFTTLAGPSISTGMEMQWINGHQTTNYSRSYTFILKPLSAGKHTIGSASIEVEGKRYTTKPIILEVVDEQSRDSRPHQQTTPGEKPERDDKRSVGAEASITSEDIFIMLTVSDKEVYKGETLRATLMLYTRVGYPDIRGFDLPTFNDFWTQELQTLNERSRAEYNGRVYDTYKLTEYLIAPQRTGSLQISPAELDVAIQVVTQDNSRQGFFYSGRQVSIVNRKLRSAPVTIKVKGFPDGAPASFKGAVGSFTLAATAPEATMSANSSNEISVTISGSGNLKFVTAPRLILPESFELYDTKVVDNIRTTATGSSGSITYSYPFVARSAGEYTIEPIVFSYFDLETAQYKTLSTESFTITVTGDGTVVEGGASSPEAYADYGRMKQLDRDIRFIHTGKLPKQQASMFIFSPAYWLVVVLAIALFVVIYVVMRKRIRENRNIVARRMRQADKVAVQRLRMAQRSMAEGNRHAFYEEMLRAMWGYISDKFNIPVSNLTKETIREQLYRRGVSASDAEQFCQIISRSDEAQYAPSTDSDMGEVYDDAVAVISKIEDVIKR
ncbi:MAG: protein BatD [Alistipes sp.]|nr:protein BatD [Alistipes sp.]